MTEFCCPICSNKLVEDKDFYVCERCGNKWPIRKGIGLFCKSKYWGEVTQKEMNEILEMIEKRGMDKGLELAKTKKDSVVYRFGYDPSRADWRFYLPVNKNWKVLDAGCGLGGMIFPLAKVVSEVVAFDSSFERIKFVNLNISYNGLDNIKTFVGDFDNLPLKDSIFDLIILNGVLEWTGIPNESKNPREVQKDVLRKCLRLLKPGGYIYIGIENRFALNYFTTGRDHSGLRYTSLMPRFLANIYTSLRIKKPYRTYTYTKRGYEKLLRETGFKKEKFLLLAPGYNFPKYIIPYDNIYCLQYAIKKLISPNSWKKRFVKKASKFILFLKLYRKMFFCFGIISKKVKA